MAARVIEILEMFRCKKNTKKILGVGIDDSRLAMRFSFTCKNNVEGIFEHLNWLFVGHENKGEVGIMYRLIFSVLLGLWAKVGIAVRGKGWGRSFFSYTSISRIDIHSRMHPCVHERSLFQKERKQCKIQLPMPAGEEKKKVKQGRNTKSLSKLASQAWER